jgi:hypothetical protein
MTLKEKEQLLQQRSVEAAKIVGTIGVLLQRKQINASQETLDRLQHAWNEYMMLSDLLEKVL